MHLALSSICSFCAGSDMPLSALDFVQAARRSEIIGLQQLLQMSKLVGARPTSISARAAIPGATALMNVRNRFSLPQKR